MAPRKAQTEAKAKGLIGWKNGKKDSSAKGPKVGDYAGKSLNLTKKQLAKGGVKKVSTLKTINISNTKFVKGKGVVDRTTGKLIRGKMDMGGGNIAVYKNGKRVNLTKPKPMSRGSVSSGGSRGTDNKPKPNPKPNPKSGPKPGRIYASSKPSANKAIADRPKGKVAVPAKPYPGGRGVSTTTNTPRVPQPKKSPGKPYPSVKTQGRPLGGRGVGVTTNSRPATQGSLQIPKKDTRKK